MIIDKTENLLFYEKLLPNLKNGWQELLKLEEWKEGKYVFEGGYFMIQTGKTKPLMEGTFEAHRKYADVQIMLKGCEEMAWSAVSDMKTVIPYDEEKDAERLDGERIHHMLISEGMFYIAFPKDGHKAVSHREEEHTFTKCVMKIRI